MRGTAIAGVILGFLLFAAPNSSAEPNCSGRWAPAADYLIGQRIPRLHVDGTMVVSENACADYSRARYVIVRNPNNHYGKAHHYR